MAKTVPAGGGSSSSSSPSPGNYLNASIARTGSAPPEAWAPRKGARVSKSRIRRANVSSFAHHNGHRKGSKISLQGLHDQDGGGGGVVNGSEEEILMAQAAGSAMNPGRTLDLDVFQRDMDELQAREAMSTYKHRH